MEQKKLFKDKYVGYHTLGLKLDDVKVLGKTNYKLVDLGLPSGTLWADRNIGAENLQDLGLYFRWGEVKGYVDETDIPYKYGSMADSLDPEFAYSKYNIEDGLIVLESKDDAATVNIGEGWHMPSLNQINELLQNTTKEIIFNDPNSEVTIALGILFTSTINGESIYFPLPYDPINPAVQSDILSNDLFQDKLQEIDYLNATNLRYRVSRKGGRKGGRKGDWVINCYSETPLNRELFSHVRGVYN